MKAKKKSIMQTLREIRDKQSEKYYNNPELLKQDLKKIRKNNRPTTNSASAQLTSTH